MKKTVFNEVYNIKMLNNIYQLNIEIKNQKIKFIINILGNSIDFYFMSEINSIELIEKLGLNINKYIDSEGILNIFNEMYNKNKISLIHLDENSIFLIIKYTILNEELKYEIKLEKVKMKKVDKLNALLNQINFLTNKFQDNLKIKDMNKVINELNKSIEQKEKQLKNIIEEKDNIIKDISNKLSTQEKMIKKLNCDINDNKILKEFKEIENNVIYNLNLYRQEINNIKNTLINDINFQLNKHNSIIRELATKFNNCKLNEFNDSSIEEEKINKKESMSLMDIDQSLINKKINSKKKSDEDGFLKEILKEMDNNKNKRNQNNYENEQTENIDINNNSSSINFNIQENNLNENDFMIEESGINEEYSINNYNDKINYKFRKNPKYLKYKLDVTYTNTNWGANDIFEVFLSYKDNQEYIISPNYVNHSLEIYSLKKIKLIKSLKGHKNRITVIRYFINKKNNNFSEYLISADYNKIIIVWDISDNYNFKYKINTQYGTTIYSCLIIFPKNINENYVISSTFNTSEDTSYSSTKIYNLENGEFIKYINNTNSEKIYYLLDWYNRQNSKFYVIQFALKKIIISNLIEDELNSELVGKNEYYHYSGFIYSKNNNDYLGSSSSNGYINIWDLFNKKLIKIINTNNCILFHIIKWSDQYIIVADYNNKSFKVIDLYSGEIIKDFNGYHTDAVKCIKKIYHPIYGESLLTSGEDKTIKLWII